MTKKILSKKCRQKVVLDGEIVNLRYGQFSQNRLFKILPVNFRYNRTSVGKSKKFNLYLLFFSGLLDAEIRSGISCFVKKWHGGKKKLPKYIYCMIFLQTLAKK
jgi:hypothetical protein